MAVYEQIPMLCSNEKQISDTGRLHVSSVCRSSEYN